MAAVFPDAAACLENIPGDRADSRSSAGRPDGARLPRGGDGLRRPVARPDADPRRRAAAASRATRPSRRRSSHEILNAQPYAFLDDAPLEERRTQAVHARRASEPASASDLGALDAAAIERVRDEERPDPRDADELHDALLTAGFLTAQEAGALPPELFAELARSRRAALVDACRLAAIWIAAERLPELAAVHPGAAAADRTTLTVPASRAARDLDARRRRSSSSCAAGWRMVGPTTAAALAASLAIAEQRCRRGAARARSRRRRAARPLHAARTTSNGATAGCSRASIATRSTGCAPRSSRSPRPTSCASCSRGSTSSPAASADRHRRPARRLSIARRLRTAGERVGTRGAAGAARPLRAVMLDMLCLTGEAGWARLSARSRQACRANPRCGSRSSCASTPTAWHALRPDASAMRTPRWRRTAAAMLETLRARGRLVRSASSSRLCALDEAAAARRRSPSSSPRAWSRRTDSPAFAPSSARLRRQPPARLRRA